MKVRDKREAIYMCNLYLKSLELADKMRRWSCTSHDCSNAAIILENLSLWRVHDTDLLSPQKETLMKKMGFRAEIRTWHTHLDGWSRAVMSHSRVEKVVPNKIGIRSPQCNLAIQPKRDLSTHTCPVTIQQDLT